MKNSRNGTRTIDPMDALRSDIAAIRDDLMALASGRLNSMSESARDRISQAGETAKEFAGQAKEQVGLAHQRLSDAAARRPLTTIILAVAAGAAFVKFAGWCRRDRE